MYSITMEDIKELVVCDAPLDVILDNLPLANVILSSNLAYSAILPAIRWRMPAL